MTKRVLAFLMVIAMVFSLIPTVVVAEETETTVDNGYTMYLQKAHNQTDGTVTWDIYLQANNADQGNVTGFQFKVTPAADKDVQLDTSVTTDTEGFVVYGSGETVVASAEGEAVSIPVGTTKVQVMTLPLVGADAGDAAAFDLTEVEVTTDAETKNRYPMAEPDPVTDDYAGLVEVEKIPFTACAAHGTTGWTGVSTLSGELAEGSYYLTEDVDLTETVTIADGATVTVCLNGHDITAATAGKIFVMGNGETLNICDCTATGVGADYTAGRLLPKNNHGGAIRFEDEAGATVNFYGGVIDGELSTQKEASAIFVQGGNTLNMFGGKVVNFTQANKPAEQYGPIILRGTQNSEDQTAIDEVNATIQGVTFVNCGSAIVGVPTGGNNDNFTGEVADSVTLTVEGVTVLDSVSGAKAVDVNYGVFKSVTLKGDCQFDAPVFVADGETVTLDLGANADVNIVTDTELTQEQFNERVKMAEGGSLAEGALLYETAGLYVTYDETAKQFVFAEGHAIKDNYAKGITFKPWQETDSLPVEGRWYLENDVDITATTTQGHGKELYLDLNGKTVTSSGAKIYSIYGTLNLFDGTSTYDDEGNWVSSGTGMLTGSTENRGAIRVWTGGTFNFYSGVLSGNGLSDNNNSYYGGAIYLSNYEKSRSSMPGAVFNMHGGEITGSYADAGSAIYVGSDTGYNEKHVHAKLSISGGKIHGNTASRVTAGVASTTGGGYAAIYLQHGTELTISGGEFYNNTSRQGAVISQESNATGKVTISGGKFYENSAAIAGVLTVRNSAPVEITGGEFTGNNATSNSGAAIVVLAEATAALTVSGGKWENNTGFLYANGTPDATINVSNITITGCTTQGVYLKNASAAFNNCTFTGNNNGSYGTAIRVSTNASLRLEDTVITGNNNTNGGTFNCGAVAIEHAQSQITVAGRTVIAGNTTSNSTRTLCTDLVLQDNGNKVIKVDNLEAGSHIDAYSFVNGLEASDVVVTADGAAPTSWDCGWITYYQSEATYSSSARNKHTVVAGQNVSYVDLTTGDADNGVDDPTFVFGHYHTKADGTSYPLTEWTDATKLPSSSTAGADLHYYLTSNVTITAQLLLSNGGTLELCTNGHDIGTTSTTRAFRNEGGTLIITDCTAGYDKDGHLLTGSQVKGFHRTDGNGAVFFAPGSSSATDKTVILSTTTFKGIEFVNCYDTSTSEGFGGGAIQVRKQNSLIVDGCKFTGCYSVASGGAINIKREGGSYGWGEKTVKNTVFEDNYTGKIGGAIYVEGNWKGEVLTVDNCVFNGNYAKAYAQTDNADTTDVDESTLATKATGLGGAIYAKNVNVEITDSTFDGNYTSANGLSLTSIDACTGGAIYAGSGAYVTVDGSVFTDNSSAKAAGAIVNTSTRGFVVTNTEFSGNNAATAGGAIYVSGGTVSATGCSFEKNTATSDGGAIYVSATCTLNNCEFTSNEANRGGAVYTNGSGSRLNATSSSFTSNSATTTDDKMGGGAMYLMHGKITLNACDFDANEAKFGAALVFNGHNADATLNNLTIGKADDKGCTFTNNVADAQGGAIYIYTYNGYGSTTSITGANFESNTASSGGGAIYMNSGSNTAEKTGGPIVTITDTAITKNKGADGSAISANGYSATTLSNCTITDNVSNSSWGALFVQAATTSVTMTGLMNVTGNADNGTYGNSNLNMWHKADNQGKVTFKDLDINSVIGVTASNDRYNADPVVGNVTFTEGATTTIADVAPCFISDNENRYITHVKDDGTLMLTNYVDESGNTYQTLQAAYDAVVTNGTATKFVVQAGDGIDKGLALSKSTTIDLNGKNISKITTGESTLKLIDSETNDFDIADGVYGQVTVEGNMDAYCKDGSNHYVVITEDGVSSAHRVYVSIVSRLLRPKTYGAGFKAIYAGDQMVADVAAFGINLTGQTGDGRQWAVVPFSGMEPGLPEEGNPNEKLVAVTNLAPDHWEDTLYGQAYVTVNGVPVESTERSLVMKTMAASALNALEPTNLVYLQIQEMLDKYPELSVN